MIHRVIPHTMISFLQCENGMILPIFDRHGDVMLLSYEDAKIARKILGLYLQMTSDAEIKTHNQWLWEHIQPSGKSLPQLDNPLWGDEPPIRDDRIIQKAADKREGKSGHVYVLYGLGLYKIGMTKGDVESRMKTISNGMDNLEIVMYEKVIDMPYIESYLHDRFEDKRYQGEWFNLADKDLDIIKGILTRNRL